MSRRPLISLRRQGRHHPLALALGLFLLLLQNPRQPQIASPVVG